MEGRLGDILFPDLIRDLSRQDATGRLSITHSGDTIDVFFESGIPVVGSSSLPDEQMECRLVRDGLLSGQQIKAAWLAASNSSRSLEAVLVGDGTMSADAMAEAQRALSLSVINLAFEWYAGDYEFIEEPLTPGPRLTWSASDCILSGARYASASEAMLDVIAPDYKIVGPVPEAASSIVNSATLTSVEGYVLSCIQEPVTILEASSITGLSHVETRRALSVLIVLGLLAEPRSPADPLAAEDRQTPDERPVAKPAAPVDAKSNGNSAHHIVQADVAAVGTPSIPVESQGPGVTEPVAGALNVEWCPVEYVSGEEPVQQQAGRMADHRRWDEPEDLVDYAAGDPSIQEEPGNTAERWNSADYDDPSEYASSAQDAPEPEIPDAEEIVFTSAEDSPGILAETATQAADEDEAPFALESPLIELEGTVDPVAEELTSEEALYQQRLFLEQRLQEEAPPEAACSSADQSGNGNLKSLTTAIQELNLRLRLAGSSGPLPPAPTATDIPVQADAASPVVAEEPLQAEGPKAEEPKVEEARVESCLSGEDPVRLAEPPTFDEPFRFGEPATEDQISEPAMSTSPPVAESPITRAPETPVSPSSPAADFPPLSGGGFAPVIETPQVDQIPGTPEPPQVPASLPRHDSGGGDERFLKKVIGKLDSRLSLAESSDFYQLLGIDKLASNGNINKSYDEMVAIYEGYRTRWPEDRELQSKISLLMDRIKQAHETVGNVDRRRVYDMPPFKEESRPSGHKDRLTVGDHEPHPVHKQGTHPADVQPGNDVTKPRPARKKPIALPLPSLDGKIKRPPAAADATDSSKPDIRNPFEGAEEYYKRGRAAYERSDLNMATHLLREAIKLDPNRSSYHYQLGLVLSTLSQARKEHKHDKGCHVTCRLGGFLTRNQKVRHEAERHLLKANELDPANPEIKLKLGLLYKDAAMDQKSQQYFHEALMLDGNSELAKLELGLDREPGPAKPVPPGKKKSRLRSSRK